MRKKLIGFMFAATMLFGASMTVFAAGDVSDNEVSVSGNDAWATDRTGDLTMESAVEKPRLEVTITAGTQVIANPYKIKNDALALTGDETLKGSTITFENKSNTAISVGLTGQIQLADYAANTPATPAADQVTVASSLSSLNTAKTKQVCVQAEIYADNTKAKKLQTPAGTAPEKALVYSKTGAKMTNAPILAAAGDTTTVTDSSSKMFLELTGGTSKSPTSQWTDADAFKVITKYDIQFGDKTKASVFK